MLLGYGIPSSQIVAVSAGEKDLKVQTGDGVKNAENRRVRVVKEVHYTEEQEPQETKVIIKNKQAGAFVMPVAQKTCEPKPSYGYPYGKPVKLADDLDEEC
jgi:hypothetical protein